MISILPVGNQEGIPIPSCGVCSAFALLHATGNHRSLHDVTSVFRTVSEDDDLRVCSLLEVRQAVDALGVKTNAMKLTETSAAAAPSPAILYIRPGMWPKSTQGHFVTLVGHRPDGAVLLDWSGVKMSPAVIMEYAELDRLWSGEIIVPASRFRRTGSWLMMCAALIPVVLIMTWSMRRQVSRLIIPVMLTPFAGCGSDMPAPEDGTPLIVCDAPIANLGTIPGTSATHHKFVLRVNNTTPVTITGIHASCGCTTPNEALVGEVLQPGRVCSLPVRIRPTSEGALTTKTLRVITDPPSPSPLILAVRFARQDPPRASVAELNFEATPNSVVRKQFFVTYRRPVDAASVFVKQAPHSSGRIKVTAVNTRTDIVTENAATGHKLAIDTSTVEVSAQSGSQFGVEKTVLQLPCTAGNSVQVPVRVNVPHPLRFDVDRLFLGSVKADVTVTRRMRFDCREGFPLPTVRVDGDTVRNALPGNSEISVTIRTPAAPGYFGGEFICEFEDETLPDVVIPVSGVVAKSGK